MLYRECLVESSWVADAGAAELAEIHYGYLPVHVLIGTTRYLLVGIYTCTRSSIRMLAINTSSRILRAVQLRTHRKCYSCTPTRSSRYLVPS